MRIKTYRVILLTGLLFFLANVILLTLFSEFLTASFRQFQTLPNEDYVDDDPHLDNNDNTGVPETYKKTDLVRWSPAPTVVGPRGLPGEMGQAVHIPFREQLMKEKFKINYFNLLASNVISFNRSLPDVRSNQCKNKKYPELLPTTSVVIVFHNEAWSTLLRTIWSVFNRSPRSLLKEIILVDDASDQKHLGHHLEDYVQTLPLPVLVLRSKQRLGLVKARLLGASRVRSPVITFLDAHCECAEGWLEPLLARLVRNRRSVACPIIDIINKDTFLYFPIRERTWGGFNWKLNFFWFRAPQRELDRLRKNRTAPLRTPIMAGGLFSIDREYFTALGSYDERFEIWGYENIEISFRIWQCGGRLEIVPCSHVGHVYRDSSPHSFPGDVSEVLSYNAARVAEVWLDEWRDFYYAVNPEESISFVDVSARRELRRRLKCRSFRWFLENIYPESLFPRDYHYLGYIRNVGTNMCLDTMHRSFGENLGANPCDNSEESQLFIYTKNQQVAHSEYCLDAGLKQEAIRLARCDLVTPSQTWTYDPALKTLRHMSTSRCLQGPNPRYTFLPRLKPCNHSPLQQWDMKEHFKWQAPDQKKTD